MQFKAISHKLFSLVQESLLKIVIFKLSIKNINQLDKVNYAINIPQQNILVVFKIQILKFITLKCFV